MTIRFLKMEEDIEHADIKSLGKLQKKKKGAE